jgi:integrase
VKHCETLTRMSGGYGKDDATRLKGGAGSPVVERPDARGPLSQDRGGGEATGPGIAVIRGSGRHGKTLSQEKAPTSSPKLTFQSHGGGLYRHVPSGAWYERPWIDGKRTWRKLDSAKQGEARGELAARRSSQARSRLGLAINPYAGGQTVAAILDEYERSGFPDRHRRGRNDKARATETRNTGYLRRIIGDVPAASITAQVCDHYADTRRRETADSGRNGSRTVDVELQTLSNALSYARRIGMTIANPLQHGRPRYHRASEARHARDCSPSSGNELHLLARTIAEDPRGEALAWQCLLSALTGCRTSEIIRLRFDAPPRKPGNVEGEWLWIERSKGGVNPYVVLHPDLKACMAAHLRWHQEKHPESPWWFPSPRKKGAPVESTSLVHAISRAAGALGLGQRTSHGLRAFYVTVRRSQGISDGQIAAEIGDKSVALISTTYGQVPPGWRGGPELSWVPTDGNPSFWDAHNPAKSE